MKVTDDRDALFHVVGRAHALRILFDVTASCPGAGRQALIHGVLAHIGHDLALAMPSADCPEGWVEGMQEIEEALTAELLLLDRASANAARR
jgi:hypothetical protein